MAIFHIVPASAAQSPAAILRFSSIVTRNYLPSPDAWQQFSSLTQPLAPTRQWTCPPKKPILTAKLDAGQVIVGWAKQGRDGVEIQADAVRVLYFWPWHCDRRRTIHALEI